MDGPSPSKETILGFQAQVAEGTGIDSSVIWCPYNESTDLGQRGGLIAFDQADTVHQRNIAIPDGRWWEGSMPITLRPVAPLVSALFGASGILNSAARDNYNRGPVFTVFRVDKVAGVQRTLAGKDCRVASWTLGATAGQGEVISFSMDIRGKSDFATSVTPSGSFGAPYLWTESSVRIKLGGGAWAADINFEELEISGEENLSDISAGMRLGSGLNPHKLDNMGDQEVRITATRDQVDTLLYDQWILQRANSGIDSGNAMGLEFILTSGGQTITLTANRCGIAEYTDSLPGSKVGLKKEAISFDCYASADGATGALVAS